MAKITEVRLTLAAFIYGIEIDLKNLLKKAVIPFQGDINFIADVELEKKLIERFTKENPGVNYKNTLEDVVDFLDFGDCFVVLKKNEVFLTKEASNYLKSVFPTLTLIIPVRNRVMHTRPLLGGDFALVYDFVTKLKSSDPIAWNATLETRELIERDPFYVLTLKYPSSLYNGQSNKVIHNLPVPDFDETGFIGRDKDIDDLKKLIFSNKVVTILGDGGIGKTALA